MIESPSTQTRWLESGLVWPEDRVGTAIGERLQLLIAACRSCGRSSFPATPSCSWCGAPTVYAAMNPEGHLIAATAVLHAAPGSLLEPPYAVALARFPDAGLDILGTVVGAKPVEELTRGSAVSVVASAPFSDPGLLHYAYVVCESHSRQSSIHQVP